MLTFIEIIILLAIAWAIFKYAYAYLARCFGLTLCMFLGIGSVMFFLSVLTSVVSTSTAWMITLIPTFLAFVYDIYELSNTSAEQINRDVKELRKRRYGFDKYGQEIDFFQGRKCCGNCKFNRGRPPYGGHPTCEMEGHYNDVYVIPSSLSLAERQEVENTYCCSRWQHF